MRTRSRLAAGSPAVAVIAALAIAAPAVGKSSVQMTVSTHRLEVGQSVRVVAGGGSDDAGQYSQVCVELQAGRRWHDLRCSRSLSNFAAPNPVLRFRLTERDPVVLHLRAQLIESNRGGRDRSFDQVTPVETVRFTR